MIFRLYDMNFKKWYNTFLFFSVSFYGVDFFFSLQIIIVEIF